jgi:FKBP-type peptidyl-prolyl cis-trans isomerase
MKRNLIISIVVVFITGLLVSCGSKNKTADLQSKNDSLAYVIGADVANNVKQYIAQSKVAFDSLMCIKGFEDATNGAPSYDIAADMAKQVKNFIKQNAFDFDSTLVIKGFKDVMLGHDSTVLTKSQRKKIFDKFKIEMQVKQMQKAAEAAKPNKDAGAKWLEENKTKPGVAETKSGLQYKAVKMGKGKQANDNDSVFVTYEGKTIDGKVFDKSTDPKKPAIFVLSIGRLVPGFIEGLKLMKEGSSYELYFPSDLGYGDQGNQSIPGGSALIFKVDLLKVKPGPPQTNPQPQQQVPMH